MRLLADENVPVAYVSALRGDGHDVVWSRDVDALGTAATDGEIVSYASEHEYVVLTTDSSDFAHRETDVGVLVAPQDMRGGEVRQAVERLTTMALDPSTTAPIWLSGL